MALDYKLHKATDKKIDGLVEQRLDIKRREENLIEKIEQFQKDNKQLTSDKETWEEQKSLEFRQLQQDKETARDIQEQAEKALKSTRADQKALLKREKTVEQGLNTIKKDSVLTKSFLKRLKKKDGILYGREQSLNDGNTKLLGSKRKMQKDRESVDVILNRAKDKETKANNLLSKAKQKNSEANGLKIKLGIQRKNLEIIRKDLKEQRQYVGIRRNELDMVGKELRLKRKLLTKAYSVADLDVMDKKIEQKLGTRSL